MRCVLATGRVLERCPCYTSRVGITTGRKSFGYDQLKTDCSAVLEARKAVYNYTDKYVKRPGP